MNALRADFEATGEADMLAVMKAMLGELRHADGDPARPRTANPLRASGALAYPGVRVVDDAVGVTYEVAAQRIDGIPTIVVLTVLPHPGVAFNARTPVPVATLARLACWWAEDDIPAFGTVRPLRSEDDRTTTRPPLADVARRYRDTLDRKGSPRRQLADIYGVPLRTADGWIAAARKAGHLTDQDRDPRGRPHRKDSRA